MRIRHLLLLSLFLVVPVSCGATEIKPKLILAVVVDQFRYDYLTRFRASWHGGIARLLGGGAVFTDARYIHYPTVTAVGHSTFMSGATPSVSGIVGNDWYDSEEHRAVTSVCDRNTRLVGLPQSGQKDDQKDDQKKNCKVQGSSPHRLL